MLYQSIAMALRAGVLLLSQGGYVAAGLEPQAEPAACSVQPAIYALWDASRVDPREAPVPVSQQPVIG